MIISVSRRTDIPAFYTDWFINRILEGYCAVPNPFNSKQVSFVPLKPEVVDVIVFWTRNPSPLPPYLSELDKHGYRYYFQYTLMDNPKALDKKSPSLRISLETFKKLGEHVGPERVVWRYDPIVFTRQTGVQFHIEAYQKIAETLKGWMRRSVISIVDIYRKTRSRLQTLDHRR
jgi:hypothetical protein